MTELYLDLMRRVLSGMIYEDPCIVNPNFPQPRYDAATRMIGGDWPSQAHSMIGPLRLQNVQECCERALGEAIPGDFMDAGTWRGGAAIMMRAVLKARGSDRTVWVADSFRGLPPDPVWDAIQNVDCLAVPQQEVEHNFDVYGLLDKQVRFLPGWFADTLPDAPVEKLAVLRLDGDLYESQRDVLTTMGPKVSPGGWIIVDDYNIDGCRKAVDEYRAQHGITAPMHEVLPAFRGWTVYWRA